MSHEEFWFKRPIYLELATAMVLQFDPAGLGLEWDGVESIRDRLRSCKSLVVPGTSKSNDGTIPECVANQDVLVPVLTRLLTSNLKLPGVPGLRPEVEIAYGKNNRTPDEATVDDDAWELRKLLRFVKRKANRSDPSLDTSMQFSLTFFLKRISPTTSNDVGLKTKNPTHQIQTCAKDVDFQELVLMLRPELEVGGSNRLRQHSYTCNLCNDFLKRYFKTCALGLAHCPCQGVSE